jgi:hypothetical protein
VPPSISLAVDVHGLVGASSNDARGDDRDFNDSNPNALSLAGG